MAIVHVVIVMVLPWQRLCFNDLLGWLFMWTMITKVYVMTLEPFFNILTVKINNVYHNVGIKSLKNQSNSSCLIAG